MMNSNDNADNTAFVSLRDGILPSPWQGHTVAPFTSFDSKMLNPSFDVLVVGGGITGVTTALRLQEAGKTCILVEAHHLGFGTTGGTTAHINTMLDTPYHTIEHDFGKEGAMLAAEAARLGRDHVARNVAAYQIACDFEYKDGILFAQTEQEESDLQQIYDASQRAGVDVEHADTIPVPLDFRRAINYRLQAQLHPLNYLYGLARAFTEAGGIILQQTRVLDNTWQQDSHEIETDAGMIRAKHLIYATHIPPGKNILHLRCAPYRSYVLAAQLLGGQYPLDLAYDMQEPYHYFRTHLLDSKRYLIVGGADHKTGHGDPEGSFRELEAYVRKHFDVSVIDYRWSSQYFEPADGLPYIGKLPGSSGETYVATGFSGNGILFGSFSALLLADLVLGNDNSHEKLFSPSRIKPVAGFSNFIKENADVAYRFVADRLGVDKLDELVQLAPDTGAVVRFDGKKIAVYKSSAGAISALSPICTHAGCTVKWNNAEKSWDCPCHGGRYAIDGKVLTGPPRQDLEKIPLI